MSPIHVVTYNNETVNTCPYKNIYLVFFCLVVYSDLSFNHLTRLEETAFVGLGLLESLYLGENSISYLGEGVFSGLTSLCTL